MNEIIVYVASGIIGLLCLFGLIMLLILASIAGVASLNSIKHKKAIYSDIQNEYNKNLADHKRENLKLLLVKECAIDDVLTANKLAKYAKRKKKVELPKEEIKEGDNTSDVKE